MIQVNGTIKLAPDADRSAIDAIVTLVKATRQEDGCIDYAMAQDLADPDTLILFERWKDMAALEAHMQAPHVAEFQKVMAANPPVGREIRMYETDEGKPL